MGGYVGFQVIIHPSSTFSNIKNEKIGTTIKVNSLFE